MQLSAALGRLLPRFSNLALPGGRNLVRDAWDLLSRVPGGKIVFSRLIGRMAPYTGTIGATVVTLREGHAEVVMPDRRAVRNHLDCVHAVALANLAELTGNIALAYALPDGARFIVTGMEIEYLKKARGRITATAECPVPGSTTRAELPVPVSLHDESGDEVARAELRSLVGPRPSGNPSDLN